MKVVIAVINPRMESKVFQVLAAHEGRYVWVSEVSVNDSSPKSEMNSANPSWVKMLEIKVLVEDDEAHLLVDHIQLAAQEPWQSDGGFVVTLVASEMTDVSFPESRLSKGRT